jgi:hypothetical protein
VIRRLTFAFVIAVCYVAASGCGGGGEACLTCHLEADGGDDVDAPVTGAAGAAGGGAGGRGGAPAGTAGSGGSGVAGTGVAGTGPAGRGGSGPAGMGGSGPAGMGGSGPAGTGPAGTGGSGPAGAAGTGPAGMGGSGPAGAAGTGPAGMGGSGPAGAAGTGPAGMGGSGPAGMGGGAAGRGGASGSAAGAGGGAAGRGGAAGAADPSIVVWYKMDETSGTTAVDSSGNARNGTVATMGGGTAVFSTTHQVGTGALNITSSSATVGGYVSLPASLNAMGATTAITIASWVNITTDRAWARVWDFNNSSMTGYMFLTTYSMAAAPNSVRFAITMTGNSGEQMISGPARLSTAAWHHIAVVLGAGATYTGTLYVDGVSVGTNAAMTLRPSNLGNTPNNWIGRSAFTADPFFHGLVDDFRVYNRALTAAEITALFAVR